MSRHKNNKSIYYTKDRKFYWSIQLMYGQHSFIVHNVDDSKTFGNIWGIDIKNAINEAKVEPFYELINSKARLEFSILNEYNCSQIMKNSQTSELKTETSKSAFKDNVQIFSTEKLQNVLTGLTIIEFPIIRILNMNK